MHERWGGRRHVLGSAASAVGAVALVLGSAACGTPGTVGGRSTTTSPETTAPGSSSTTGPATSGAASTTTSAPPRSLAPYLALWPFRSWSEVLAWEAGYRSAGTAPWHLDAGTTAQEFTMQFLDFGEINTVVRVLTNANGAHVSVGLRTTGTSVSISAVIHLVRWGSGARAPWEVVGTDDTTLSLTRPVYGATVSSPLVAGGSISGVDESVRVDVRQPSSTAPIGTSCCVPAGGTATPWSATVTYDGATDPVLTVVASTGGHVAAVERFAVTGVRPGHGSDAP